MRDQLIQYVQLLFAGARDCEDIKQEILQNTLDRYDDLIAEGKVPEAAYRLSITGIGDLSEILGSEKQAEKAPAGSIAKRNAKEEYDRKGRKEEEGKEEPIQLHINEDGSEGDGNREGHKQEGGGKIKIDEYHSDHSADGHLRAVLPYREPAEGARKTDTDE